MHIPQFKPSEVLIGACCTYPSSSLVREAHTHAHSPVILIKELWRHNSQFREIHYIPYLPFIIEKFCKLLIIQRKLNGDPGVDQR